MQQAAQFAQLAGRATGAAHSPTVTTTSSNFYTFLVSMPWPTTFSTAAEVQVVLATIPLLAIGFTGIAFGGFQLSISRLNRALLDLFISITFAFIAGILELFNVLNCELSGVSTMSFPLLAAEGLALAIFVVFKLFFLFRRTQYPAMGETPKLATLPRTTEDIVNADGRRSRWSRVPMFVHSGSYARFGVLGGIVRLAVYLMVYVIGFLEAIWRIGFLKEPTMFFGVYIASNVLQVVIGVFFAAKLVGAAFSAKGASRRSNFVSCVLAPQPFVAESILSLTLLFQNFPPPFRPRHPHFHRRPESRPQPRILLRDASREIFNPRRSLRLPPRSDRGSPAPHARLSLLRPLAHYLVPPEKSPVSPLPALQQQQQQQEQQQQRRTATTLPRLNEPALPERIVVRRSSRLPSWLGGRGRRGSTGSEGRELAGEPGSPLFDYDPFGREGERRREARLRSPETEDTTGTNFPDSSRGPSPAEGEKIGFGGVGGGGRAMLVTPVTKQASTVGRVSIATYDVRGERLSSPTVDREFSIYGNLIKQQRELEAMSDAKSRGTSTSRSQYEDDGNVGSRFVIPPPPPMPTVPLSLLRPTLQPVQSGVGEKISSTSSSDPSRRSETSTRTNGSSLSLSGFPDPPSIQAPAVARPLTTASTSTNLVTDNGLEFELFPPRPSFAMGERERTSLDSERSNFTSFDVTSMIVGDSRAMSTLRRDILENTIAEESLAAGGLASGSSLDPQSPFMPTSPVPSELGEVRQATRVPSNRGGGDVGVQRPRKDSLPTVEGAGRVIPPREDQDFARRASPTFSTPASGLPANPRRVAFPRQPASPASSASTVTRFRIDSGGSSVGQSPDTSVATYDPKRAFERPRPAPLVLSKEEAPAMAPQPRGVGQGVKVVGTKRTRSRGGRVKDISVVRDGGESSSWFGGVFDWP